MIIDQIESVFVPNQVAARYQQQAFEHFKQKRFSESVDFYSRALSLQLDNSNLYYNRGAVYTNMGDYDAAIADFTTAISLKPVDPGLIYFHRAQIHRYRKAFDEGIQDYAEALRLGLDLYKALIALEQRGHMLIAQQEWTRAENNFLELLRIDEKPNYAAHVGIGYVRLCLKDYKDAIEHLTHAILIEPQKGYAYYHRGLAYFENRVWKSALSDFEEASRFNPASPAARNNCGAVRVHLSDLEGAQADFGKALGIEANFPYAYIGLADIHFLRGEYDLALENAQKAHELVPEVDGISATLAVTYHALGQVERAAEIWRELMAKDEHYGDVEWVKQEHTWPEPLVEEARKLIARLPK
ncbi:MAG: tetratricopeptide repeat protein [Chloroflexota bacterium]